MNQRSALAKRFTLISCLLLTGCDIPALFWEEEARKVVDDTVDEEEKLHPQKVSFQRI